MEQQTATFGEFALQLGCKRSYITKLKGEGRLVLSDDGKRVRVAESLALIEATRDPSKAGVAARHAAKRAGQGEAPAAAPIAQASPEEAGVPEDDEGAPEAPPDPRDKDYYQWRTRTERAKALNAERLNALAEGKLMDAAEVSAGVSSAITTLRTRLESLPDVLGPRVAALDDEAQVRAILAEEIQHALEETSRQFHALTRTPEAA